VNIEIDRHYVLNLKKRSLRLGAWLGSNIAFGFPVDRETLTIVSGIDASRYGAFEDIVDDGIDSDIKELEILKDLSGPINFRYKGLLAATIAQVRILKRIEKGSKANTWSVVWEDDCILNGRYEAHFPNMTVPEDACILQIAKNHHYRENPEDPYLSENPNFYKGLRYPNHDDAHYSMCFSQCYAVNPKGASMLLQLWADTLPTVVERLKMEPETPHHPLYFEHLAAENPDMSHSYTYRPPITRILWIKGHAADVFIENQEHGLEFRNLRVREL